MNFPGCNVKGITVHLLAKNMSDEGNYLDAVRTEGGITEFEFIEDTGHTNPQIVIKGINLNVLGSLVKINLGCLIQNAIPSMSALSI